MVISDDLISPKMERVMYDLNKKNDKVKKLVPNLYDKTKYILHYANLKFYLSHGLKLKKIHRGVSFIQTKWLAEYINFNTEKRKLAHSEFQKINLQIFE